LQHDSKNNVLLAAQETLRIQHVLRLEHLSDGVDERTLELIELRSALLNNLVGIRIRVLQFFEPVLGSDCLVNLGLSIDFGGFFSISSVL